MDSIKKVLRWVVDKVPDLRDIEDCRAVVVDYRKDTLRWYSMLEYSVLIESNLVELEKKLKWENLSDSEKQILCDQAERFLKKLDEIYAEAVRILKTENCPHGFANFSNVRSHYQDLIKQYRLSKDCGNQTSLVTTTSTGDKDPNDETVIDTGTGAIENAENAEVSSKYSATHGSRKQPSIANSRSSRRRKIEAMELENLRAKKETEQRLRERQLELEQELRRVTFATATTTTATRARVTSKGASARRWTASSTAWASTWNGKKESRGRRRKTSETWAYQRKLKSIWISGRWDRKCWIKTKSQKNSRVGRISGSTVCP